jgi:hypothetical protein
MFYAVCRLSHIKINSPGSGCPYHYFITRCISGIIWAIRYRKGLDYIIGALSFAVISAPTNAVEVYMQALNDLAKIELDKNEFGFGSTGKDTAESGILVGLPDKFNFFGFWSFAFENSFMNREDLDELYKYWETKIGRRVHWTALAERGNIIEKDGNKFAFVKLTSLIAEDEPDSKANNVHSDGAGSFGVEQ